jgi:hypothetical protein
MAIPVPENSKGCPGLRKTSVGFFSSVIHTIPSWTQMTRPALLRTLTICPDSIRIVSISARMA